MSAQIRHPSVDLPHHLIRLSSGDCAGMQPFFASRWFPAFSKASENERGIIFHLNRVQPFPTKQLLPFIEAIDRNQASPLFESASGKRVRCQQVSALASIVLYAIAGQFYHARLRKAMYLLRCLTLGLN